MITVLLVERICTQLTILTRVFHLCIIYYLIKSYHKESTPGQVMHCSKCVRLCDHFNANHPQKSKSDRNIHRSLPFPVGILRHQINHTLRRIGAETDSKVVGGYGGGGFATRK